LESFSKDEEANFDCVFFFSFVLLSIGFLKGFLRGARVLYVNVLSVSKESSRPVLQKPNPEDVSFLTYGLDVDCLGLAGEALSFGEDSSADSDILNEDMFLFSGEFWSCRSTGLSRGSYVRGKR
jgi:hypothetical protein